MPTQTQLSLARIKSCIYEMLYDMFHKVLGSKVATCYIICGTKLYKKYATFRMFCNIALDRQCVFVSCKLSSISVHMYR